MGWPKYSDDLIKVLQNASEPVHVKSLAIMFNASLHGIRGVVNHARRSGVDIKNLYGGYYYLGEGIYQTRKDTIQSRVINYLDNCGSHFSWKELTETLGITRKQAYNAVYKLETDGVIKLKLDYSWGDKEILPISQQV